MSKWFAALLIAALVSGLALAPGVAPALAQAERLQVVASFSILADVVAQVAGESADVRALIPIGADPHSYVPTPQDLIALAQADVVFLVGAGFEESLLSTLENAAAEMNLVTVSSCVEILPFGGEASPHAEGEAHAAEEAHAGHAGEPVALCEAHHAELEALHGTETEAHAGHAHVEPLGMLYTLACGGHHDEAEGEHAHATGSCDPHVWTDPANGMLWALFARDTLSQLDPAHAETYAANAAAYVAALDSLTAETLEPLAASIPAENRKLVTGHLAFGYLADRFDLTLIGTIIPGGSSLAEPSAAEIAGLITAIREQGVPAVFAETTVNPELAQRVADETGAAFYSLYSGTLSAPDGPAPTYLDYLRYNMQTLARALGGTE